MDQLAQREGRSPSWEYKKTISAGTESDAIKIPPLGEGSAVSVTLVVGESSEGNIHFTTSPDADVKAGIAVWQEWPYGACVDTCSDALIGPATGLKLIRISGTVGIEIVA